MSEPWEEADDYMRRALESDDDEARLEARARQLEVENDEARLLRNARRRIDRTHGRLLDEDA